jgi:class 3 adenylate cyclase/tetratricopeptide (TPR) repeat protein
MPRCTRCGQDNPAGFRFCGACAAPLEAEAALEERKIVTALFADIVGSTARAEELDPEDVRAMLAPYYARVRSELERFGGSVEKFIGDAVVGLFGAPVAHEDDPERAVRAAFAVRDAVADLNASDSWLDLHIRIGVHTGEALVVVGARASEGEGMASGDVMNTAARLQSAAPTDAILVGEATYQATTQGIEYRSAEPVRAKGKAEPVPVWEAVAIKEGPARRTVSRVPLVGRKAELERLRALWEQTARERRPTRAIVLGQPGIGKSRLLVELAEEPADDASVHWGRCLPYGEGITYWPVAEILKGAAGILQSDDPDTASAKLGVLLEGLATKGRDELRTMAAALANLIGFPTTPLGTYSAATITQAELHWGIRRVLELLAAERPLLLVFEDLHWAEPTLVHLIRYIGEESIEAPILLVGTGRPELAETAPALVAEDPRRIVLELEALREDESETLVAELLEAKGVLEKPLRALLTTAGGNPLFLEETVRMLADEGMLAPGDGGLAADMESLPVPSTLQALIGSRLDRLPPREKRLAQTAAVVGGTFWPGALAHMEAADGELLAELEGLEQRDFVRVQDVSTVAGEREYAFKHILIRDIAYGQVPKGRRAELHIRFAEWTSALPAGDEELIEIVAYHLEQACRLAREVAKSPVPPPVLPATEALRRSAEKVERREGLREADRFYSRALALLGAEHGEQRAELQLGRGRALIALGEIRAAREELDGVMEEAARLGRSDLECAALVELGDVAERQGRFGEAKRHLVRAKELAARLGDSQLEIRASFVFAQMRADVDGALDEAVDDLRRVVGIAEKVDDRALRAEGHLRIATLFMNLGRLREAEDELTRCLELAGELGSHRLEAEATAWLGTVKFNQGRLEEAERLGLQAREWLERTSDTYFQVQNLVRPLALLALARDDPELAERWMQEAFPIALEIGGWVLAEAYRYLAVALVRQGRIDDAEKLIRFAARNLPEEDAYARAAISLAEASVATGRGDRGLASGRYEEAIRLFEEVSTPVDLGETRLAFAKALRAFGDDAGARAQLESARELCTRMDAEGLLGQIESQLAALGEGAGPAGALVPA